MNDEVLMVLLLKGGHQLGVAVARGDAQRLVREHGEGKLPSRISSYNVHCRADVMGFSVLSEDVVGITLQQVPPQEYRPSHPYPFPSHGRS